MIKVKADMHVAPALRRWTIRGGLALVVAGAIAYIPAGGVDDRAAALRRQLDATRAEAARLRAGNAARAAEVDALRTDPAAIEARARDDLDMVYPGEMVLRVDSLDGRAVASPPPAGVTPPSGPPTETRDTHGVPTGRAVASPPSPTEMRDTHGEPSSGPPEGGAR